ncbi:MAG: hypothetical protein GY765_28105 [bacterium]|nr:hypothetical protein [bacterium]
MNIRWYTKHAAYIILLLTYLSTMPLIGGQAAVIVTVDGLSFVNSLLRTPESIIEGDQYLQTALEAMHLDLPDTSIYDFTWSRDARDTAETVQALQTFLLEKHTEAQNTSKRLIIVAHSWGSVLSYLALSSQSQQADHPIDVDLYITLGSPLGTDNAHTGTNYPVETMVINYTRDWTDRYDFCDTCLPLVDKWVNFWAWGDVISGPFQGFMPFDTHTSWSDIQIDTSYAITGYVGRNTLSTAIWHMYDSMQPGGTPDNQPLLDQVRTLIEGTPATDNPPFGSFDSPLENASVQSSVAVTGWALDDLSLPSVKIYRAPATGESGDMIYIGDATLVEGARQDIETAYPEYPYRSQAGWGYMLLTNFLPNGGNGTFTLYAVASDGGGHGTTLGGKTIHCNNADAVTPFGAIDTPAPGGIVTGTTYRNSGWVLTPMPNQIPLNGSTINVYINGVSLGHPVYDNYRSDIAALFPGYANSNSAHAYFDFNTSTFSNGVHTIAWVAVDDAGNSDGIGSRYFSISKTSRTPAAAITTAGNPHSKGESKQGLSATGIAMGYAGHTFQGFDIGITKGYIRKNTPAETIPAGHTPMNIQLNQLEPLMIHLAYSAGKQHNTRTKYTGYSLAGDTLSPLPVGSTLDSDKGIFYWQPGPGFIGEYQFIFMKKADEGQMKLQPVTVSVK